MFDVQCMSNFISVSDICGNHVAYCIPYYQYCWIIPYKSNSTPLNFFLGGGGGPLFSFVNYLCVTFVNQYVDFRGVLACKKRQ